MTIKVTWLWGLQLEVDGEPLSLSTLHNSFPNLGLNIPPNPITVIGCVALPWS